MDNFLQGNAACGTACGRRAALSALNQGVHFIYGIQHCRHSWFSVGVFCVSHIPLLGFVGAEMLDHCKDLLEALWFLAWCPVVLFSLLKLENFPGIIIIIITLIYTDWRFPPELYLFFFLIIFSLLNLSCVV